MQTPQILIVEDETITRNTLKSIFEAEGYDVFEIVKNYEEDFKIKYVRSDEKGLSLNRNRGLVLMEGEIVGFPDDDCEYQPDTLEKVVAFFERKKNYRIYFQKKEKRENLVIKQIF